MASKSKYERNYIRNKSEYSNEHVLELVNGQSNQQYRKGKKVGPYRRPPVPVVLDPTPPQITPIGTIPIYPKKSS